MSSSAVRLTATSFSRLCSSELCWDFSSDSDFWALESSRLMAATLALASASSAFSLEMAASRSLRCLSASSWSACRLFRAVSRSPSAFAVSVRVESSLLSMFPNSRRLTSNFPASDFAFSSSAREFCTWVRSVSTSPLNPVISDCVFSSSFFRASKVASSDRISARRFCSISFSACNRSRWRVSFSISSRSSAA